MQFLKGMAVDTVPEIQPSGTYRYLLNGILSEKIGAVISEQGTSDLLTLSSESINVISTLWTIGDEVFLFCTEGEVSKILKVNLIHKTVVDLIKDITSSTKDIKLNFNPKYIVQSCYSINKYGEKIIYFTDDLNPPRYINTNAVDEIDYTYQLNLFPTIKHYPKVKVDDVIDSGGILKTGNYTFGIAYIAEDGAKTNYIGFDNFTNIGISELTSGEGGVNVDKSIRLKVENLDPAYSEVEIAVVLRDKEGSISARILPRVDIRNVGNSLSYTYTGTEQTLPISIDEILINNAYYSKAKAIAIQDSRLYLGNLKDKDQQKYFQNVANSIVAKCVVKTYTKEQYMRLKVPSFKPNEVYAFYISFIYEDGSESNAYLIQGRDRLIAYDEEAVIADTPTDNWSALSTINNNLKQFHCYSVLDPETNFGYWRNKKDGLRHHRFPDINAINSNIIQEISSTGSIEEDPPQIDPQPEPEPTPPTPTPNEPLVVEEIQSVVIAEESLVWQVDEIGVLYCKINIPQLNVKYEGIDGFSPYVGEISYLIKFFRGSGETATEFPQTGSYTTMDILNLQTTDEVNTTPVNNVTIALTIGSITTNVTFGTFTPVDPEDKPPVVIPGQWDTLTHIPVLGVKFTNITTITMPNVIGYKFYCAERNSSNSLVLDTALLHPVIFDAQEGDNRKEGYSFTARYPENVSIGIADNDKQRFTRNSFSCHPYTLLLTKDSFIGINYVRKITDINGGYISTGAGNPSIKLVKEKAKIPANITTVDLPFALTPDEAFSSVNNDREEEKLLLLLDAEGNSELEPTAGLKIEQYELRSIREDLYFPYTSQNLNSIGVLVKNAQGTFPSQTDELFGGDCYYSQQNLTVREIRRVLEGEGSSRTQSVNPNTGALLYETKVNNYNKLLYLNKVDLQLQQFVKDTNENVELQFSRYNKAYLNQANLKPAFSEYHSNTELYTKSKYRESRIIRSELAENVDYGYRVFKENNYMDIRSDRGGIMKLQPIQDNLLIHAKRGFFLTRGSDKVLTDTSGGVSSVYLGTGNIFAMPATEKYVSDLGFGGVESSDHCIHTPTGYVFIDYKTNKIYLIGEDVIPISSRGMHQEFKDIIPFTLSKQGKFEYNPIKHKPYFDFRLGYDPKYNRLLVTKIERVIKPQYRFEGDREQDLVIEAHVVEIDSNEDQYVSYGDNTVFETKYWTLSYSFDFNVWVSYHSYNPEIYIPSLTELISVNNKKVYLHNVINDLRYYGNPANFEITIVDNSSPNIEKQIASLMINSKVSSSTVEDLMETFNYAHIRNESQQSETLDIDPNLPNTRRVRGIWSYNKIRAVLNTDDRYPEWFAKKKMKGKYHIINLRYDYQSNRRIYLFSCGLQSFIPHR